MFRRNKVKILLTILFAAIPAIASAQTVSTLEMVENLSISAGSSSDIATVRDNASRPFSGGINHDGNHGGPSHDNGGSHGTPQVNPPSHNGGGHDNGNIGHHNDNHDNDNHHNNGGDHNYNPGNIHNGGYNPGHNGGVYNPYNPYNPGVIVHPYDPYNPHNGGYYPPSGPSHDHTDPVVSSGPMSTTTIIIVASVVVALVLLAILL